MTYRREFVQNLVSASSVFGSWALMGCNLKSKPNPSTPVSSAVTIYAASSTRGALSQARERFKQERFKQERFKQKRFKQEQPELKLKLQFAGSQSLRLQIEHGAQADLFISASQKHIRALEDAERIVLSKTLIYNRLALVVPTHNPAGIKTFTDLPQASRLILGLADVPIGQYSELLLKRAGQRLGSDFVNKVRAKVVSRESNVRLIRSKVQIAAADAAFVYRSDLYQSNNIKEIPIPPELQVRCEYWIALLRGGKNRQSARDVMEFFLSPPGQESFAQTGFDAEFI